MAAASTAPAIPVTNWDAISSGPDNVVKASALAPITASPERTVIARLAWNRSAQTPASGVMATAASPPAVMV